jgi:hypothetical protein
VEIFFPSEKSEAMFNLQPGSNVAHVKNSFFGIPLLEGTLLPVLFLKMLLTTTRLCVGLDGSCMIYTGILVPAKHSGASQFKKTQLKAKCDRVWFGGRIVMPEINLRRSECNKIQLACPCPSTGVIWGS